MRTRRKDIFIALIDMEKSSERNEVRVGAPVVLSEKGIEIQGVKPPP